MFQGVNNLVEDLVDITLQEKYMGEKIPEAWLNFEIQMEKYVSVININLKVLIKSLIILSTLIVCILQFSIKKCF